jgi:hypothetical protein
MALIYIVYNKSNKKSPIEKVTVSSIEKMVCREGSSKGTVGSLEKMVCREGSSKGTVGSLEKIDLLFSQQTISISNNPTSNLITSNNKDELH